MTVADLLAHFTALVENGHGERVVVAQTDPQQDPTTLPEVTGLFFTDVAEDPVILETLVWTDKDGNVMEIG